MNKTYINALQPAGAAGYLMPSPITFTAIEDEKNLEKILKDKIVGIRKNDGGNLAT